jgi:hypothetical protein
LYSSPDVIIVIKSRRMIWGHVACMGEWEMCTEIWLENLKGWNHLRWYHESIILKWILGNGLGVWIWFIWLNIGTSGGLLWTQYWSLEFHERWGEILGLLSSSRTLLYGVNCRLNDFLQIYKYVQCCCK